MKSIKEILWCISLLALTLICSCKEKTESVQPKPGQPVATNPKAVTAKEQQTPVHSFKDDWAKSASLIEFRKTMLSDLDAGNQEGFLKLISGQLQLTDGSDRGAAGIIEFWGLDGSKEKLAPLKALAESLVSNGGCLNVDEDSTFEAPSYNCLSQTQLEICGESQCGVVEPSGSPLFTAPDTLSGAIASLVPYEVVKSETDTLCDAHFTNCTWRKVSRFPGQSGFVPKAKVRTETDGFLKLLKEGSDWKILVLRYPGQIVE